MSRSAEHLDQIRSQFTRQADAYSRMEQTRDEASLKLLVGLSGVSSSDRVLDVACGPGFLTMTFAESCEHVVGLDATEEFLIRARQEAERRGLANISFVQGEAKRTELDDASFDLATCRAAFHHFLEPRKVLREMKRVVKPGGSLLIADMLANEDPEKAGAQDRVERLCDPTHVQALSESRFNYLFEELGLEVVHCPTSEIHYEMEEWMAHGGPSEEGAAEIRSLLEASMRGDLTGLRVRRKDGQLHFTHRVAAFLLRTPSA